MDVLLVVVGLPDPPTVPGAEVVALPAAPDRAAIDAALDALAGRRLAVAAADAGLAAILKRLLRKEMLASTPVGLLGPQTVRARLGLTGDPVAGDPTPVGLVRDDHGGLVLGEASLTPWDGGGRMWMRSYVDEHSLVGGTVRSFAVVPGNGSLTASVRPDRRLARSHARSGRAVTVACDDARLVVDGEPVPRPQSRRSWWYEPDFWSVYGSR